MYMFETIGVVVALVILGATIVITAKDCIKSKKHCEGVR